MNKLITNWRKSLEDIERHVDVYDLHLEDYVLSLDAWDCYWIKNEEAVCWGEERQGVINETGNDYVSDYKYFFKGDDFSVILVTSDFGDDDFFLILDNKKEL